MHRAQGGARSRKFEVLEHPADVGFLAYGASLEELFENAALAMCSLACATEEIEEREQRQISLASRDVESLLYAWLAEILAIADAESLVFRRFSIRELRPEEGSARVVGLAYGERFDKSRHAAGTYLKAVTYHQFALTETPQGWRARVFLDV